VLKLLADLPLKSKLLITSFVLLGLAVALTCALAVASYLQDAKARITTETGARARLIAQDAVPALLAHDEAAAHTALQALRLDAEAQGARLFDDRGEIIAEYRGKAWRSATLPSAAPAADADQFGDFALQTVRVVKWQEQPIGTLVVATDLLPYRYELTGFAVKM
jgi:hypothetical protein